jgi:hypothetical protein
VSRRSLVRGLLLFWALWFSVVLASNIGDALREAGLLPAGWRFASGNFALLAESFSVYALPRSSAAAAFSLVLVLQLAAAFLFWRAACEPASRVLQAGASIARPFFPGIGLFGGFLVFDEILLIYRRFPNLETTHFVIFCALLLSLLSIHVLREGETPR